ncbi:tyrosine-protein phosphatase [Cellulomonas cellasea]|uniref:Protein tyrosine phosphatase (PTP) superfamily phosphohydrolase (DUF442 family) n=1 Tax=Cellulomonas cellasea TaxID=43670 RepID=A0A7W4UGR3_9CELL|nr:tyrosine-protein phosphatase [Cellulomonas cellasea]MBB2923268.1 protein tyrosine phosphatase (PTP) superfamily phosphohydrolase (DUF442 family) [Cellulomonas cellasea]
MRALSWDGYRNVRDLGGLPSALSPTGTTLHGRVVRGPRREWLTATGRADALRWGVRTVVDLRNADEHGPRPGDPEVAALAWDGVTVVHAPTEDPGHEEFDAVCGPILDSPEYWRHNVRLLPGHVHRALAAVADAEPGVLVHCSAGRDRTGMVVALVLAHAGVPPEHVAADWAESVRAMAGGGHRPEDRQSTWDAEQVERFLAGSVPVVADVAGDVESVLDDVGLDDARRERLRAQLVG